MLLCLEVMEHIEERRAADVIRNMHSHSLPGSILIFSAAPPGQEGNGHINCKGGKWWRDQLYNHGRFEFDERHTRNLQLILSVVGGPMANWIPSNLQVLHRLA